MLSHFTLWHIPSLLVASATTFGGLLPFFNAEYAIKEFGLPQRIATSKQAQSVMVTQSARTTAIGMTLLTFYSQGKLAEFDTILIILAYLGLVDGYVCWREGMAGKAVFRASMGMLIAAWGGFGMTARW
ncbi:hypothetical protein AJ78_01524 [Emergomyces pasteurianus Ep9510]|uniref:Uncharacterized protein n=1 Tax=Emergomyces pasteurianus Ep9510 TaxID=1447872 RepID=A0A1J9QRF9_9EURO|nr:hypothetical protein AJ78_01524 [Emergomyces pasteurianus Ep9510]